jgi:hypothetical protein
MMTATEEAHRLRKTADQLLADTGFRSILDQHGNVQFTGSYYYDLMTWPDIDICLMTAEDPMHVASAIVTQICRSDAIASIYIRNEHVLKTEGNPEAVFVCTEFLPANQDLWKVDVLIGSRELVAETVAPGRELVSKLDQTTKEAILQIKSVLCKDPQYRQEIRSTDIYHAVIQEGVRDLEEWQHWWTEKQKAQQMP